MSAKIIVGSIENPIATYSADTIKKCSCVMSSALSGEELVIDQLLPVIYSAAYIRVKFVPVGSSGLITADGYSFTIYPDEIRPDKIPYGTPVYYYDGNTLVGKFYFQQAVRTAKSYFDLTAVSGVGILDGQTHYGGIYTGQTFQAVAGEIINGVFPFACAADVATVPIYNWLPIASRRANLHQLLFATGVILLKDSNGEVYFRYPDTDTLKNIPDSRIFYGGNVDYMVSASRVEVTEHTYISLESDEVVTLFDNTRSGETAVDVFVSFPDGPIHDLAVTGTITILESGVNYAVISGLGTLTGKRYTHVTRVLSKSVENHSGEQKTATVSNATLVNTVNSQNVLDRVLSYYSSARRIRSDIVLTDEKPGDQVAFNNPYNEPESAYLANMEINSGSFLRAACEMITGYIPSGGGNNYTQSIVLTGSGEWESPITGKIKVAVIGAGQGGQGGYCGGAADTLFFDYSTPPMGDDYYTIYRWEQDGTKTVYQSTREPSGRLHFCPGGTTPGAGGQPGKPGAGGKILVFEMMVEKGQRIPYSCGVGGIGGKGQKVTGSLSGAPNFNVGFSVAENEEGQLGTDTVFGDYTSADGIALDYGYLDVITNTLYGSAGENGTPGQSGYQGGKSINSYGDGPNPGEPGTGVWYKDLPDGTPDNRKQYSLSGGGTAGAAYGAPYPKGGDVPSEVDARNAPDSALGFTAGNGVKGATPIKPDTPLTIGKGGTAGHGGGGGSCAGDGQTELSGLWYGYHFYRPGGVGGDGGEAGDGAPGGIVIYM